MFNVVEATPHPGYRLKLRFADGVTGGVDLSDMANGIVSLWGEPEYFKTEQVGAHGEVTWGDGIDLCADADISK
jgi:hypothetical protein